MLMTDIHLQAQTRTHTPPQHYQRCQHGSSMIEVLVTIVILAFGMLGLAGLQIKVQGAEMESYQRAQVLILMNDMVDRINANRANVASYVSTAVIGTGDAQPTSCTGVAAGATKDLCEWSNALKGSMESSGSTKVGGAIGARGCITQIQAANATTGVCTPGIYEVAIAWQGLSGTVTSAKTCGAGLYGSDDSLRRVIFTQITVGLPSCV